MPLRNDPLPEVATAGKIFEVSGDSAANALNENYEGRPTTPEGVKKYVSYHKYAVGRGPPISNPAIDPNKRYGTTGKYEDSISRVRPGAVSPDRLHEYIKERKEDCYLRRQPLGKPKAMNFKVSDPDLRHGRKSVKSESAKPLIHPPATGPTLKKGMLNATKAEINEITRPMNRKYDWSSTFVKDPAKYRFGRASNIGRGPGNSQLTTELKTDTRTVAVKKRIMDFKNRTRYPIGRARNTLQVVKDLPKDFRFGIKGQWGTSGTKDCLAYSIEDQQPDKDLGMSKLKFSKRELLPKEHKDRRFGLPSLRRDINAPKVKSVADTNNYGDEVDAQDTLYPEAYYNEGIEASDFLEVRQAQEVRKIFEEIGIKLSDEDFSALAGQAVKEFGGLSIDSFRNVYNRKMYGI